MDVGVVSLHNRVIYRSTDGSAWSVRAQLRPSSARYGSLRLAGIYTHVMKGFPDFLPPKEVRRLPFRHLGIDFFQKLFVSSLGVTTWQQYSQTTLKVVETD